MADRPLRPATDHRLGRPLPHQPANRPQPPPKAACAFARHPPLGERAHTELPRVSAGYPLPPGRLATCSSPVRHVRPPKGTPFDLHALGTPPALILSQDQTLHHRHRPGVQVALGVRPAVDFFRACCGRRPQADPRNGAAIPRNPPGRDLPAIPPGRRADLIIASSSAHSRPERPRQTRVPTSLALPPRCLCSLVKVRPSRAQLCPALLQGGCHGPRRRGCSHVVVANVASLHVTSWSPARSRGPDRRSSPAGTESTLSPVLRQGFRRIKIRAPRGVSQPRRVGSFPPKPQQLYGPCFPVSRPIHTHRCTSWSHSSNSPCPGRSGSRYPAPGLVHRSWEHMQASSAHVVPRQSIPRELLENPLIGGIVN